MRGAKIVAICETECVGEAVFIEEPRFTKRVKLLSETGVFEISASDLIRLDTLSVLDSLLQMLLEMSTLQLLR